MPHHHHHEIKTIRTSLPISNNDLFKVFLLKKMYKDDERTKEEMTNCKRWETEIKACNISLV
jgi:hypothetical protein